MLSASVASQIVFISTLKQTAGGWVSWSWVKEGEMKIKQIVYVQPGSIYLSIGAKTSSVRNIVVYETWLVSVTGKNSIRQISCFSTREKVPGIHLFRHHSHRWLSLTAASSHQPEGEGPCDSCTLLHTTESCTLRLWRHVKKTVHTAETV